MWKVIGSRWALARPVNCEDVKVRANKIINFQNCTKNKIIWKTIKSDFFDFELRLRNLGWNFSLSLTIRSFKLIFLFEQHEDFNISSSSNCLFDNLCCNTWTAQGQVTSFVLRLISKTFSLSMPSLQKFCALQVAKQPSTCLATLNQLRGILHSLTSVAMQIVLCTKFMWVWKSF